MTTEPEAAPPPSEPVAEPEAPPEELPTVHQAIARVIAGMATVGKDQVNASQNFRYRGIDDVLAALKPELGRHGVVIVPEVEERVAEQRATARGGVLFVTHLRVRYRIYGPRGDHVEAVTWGEGTDSGDKATNKAMTGAYKYMLFEVFAVAGPQGESDADGSHPDATADPAQWYTDNGWRNADEHNQALRVLKEHLAALPEEARKAFRTWRESVPIDLAQALTKDEWKACDDKRAELAKVPDSPPVVGNPSLDVVVNKAGVVVGRRGDPAGVLEVEGNGVVCSFCKSNPCECEAANEDTPTEAPTGGEEDAEGTHPACEFCGSTRTKKATVQGKVRCVAATDCRRRAEERAKAASSG